MILAPDELTGKALDWAYELTMNLDARDMKCEGGRILILLSDEVNPPGWYHYKRRLKDEDSARKQVAERLGCLVIVPTDLISPRYAHITHEDGNSTT